MLSFFIFKNIFSYFLFIFRLNIGLYIEKLKKVLKKRSLENGIGMGFLKESKIKIKNF